MSNIIALVSVRNQKSTTFKELRASGYEIREIMIDENAHYDRSKWLGFVLVVSNYLANTRL